MPFKVLRFFTCDSSRKIIYSLQIFSHHIFCAKISDYGRANKVGCGEVVDMCSRCALVQAQKQRFSCCGEAHDFF